MSDPERPTVEKAEMFNAHTTPPICGTNVLALSIGGVICNVIWTSTSIQYFDAWQYFLKVPASVKAIQAARFKQQEK